MQDHITKAYFSYLKLAIPVVSIVLFSTLFSVIFSFPYSALIPGYIIIISYYWLIYQPILVPRLFLFISGIFFDSLMDNPLGLSSLILIITWLIVVIQRDIIRIFNFYYGWCLLFIILLISFIISSVVYFVFFGVFPEIQYMLINLLTMWASYVLIHPLLELLEKPLIINYGSR